MIHAIEKELRIGWNAMHWASEREAALFSVTTEASELAFNQWPVSVARSLKRKNLNWIQNSKETFTHYTKISFWNEVLAISLCSNNFKRTLDALSQLFEQEAWSVLAHTSSWNLSNTRSRKALFILPKQTKVIRFREPYLIRKSQVAA